MSLVATALLTVFRRGFRSAPLRGSKVLTTKRAKKGYYKGKGVLPPGHHTKHGGYRLLPHKLPRYIVPDLSGFNLKPYVEEGTPDIKVSKWTHEIVPEGERCPIERERSEPEVTSWSDRPRRQRKRRHHRKRL